MDNRDSPSPREVIAIFWGVIDRMFQSMHLTTHLICAYHDHKIHLYKYFEMEKINKKSSV